MQPSPRARAVALRPPSGGPRPRSGGFTLLELLACIGILGVLLAILAPTLSAAQRVAREVQCQANLRTLAGGLRAYAVENGGRFPPNVTIPSSGPTWVDDARIGRFVAASAAVDGGPFVCPDDRRGARRSYAMNAWASSKLSRIILTQSPPAGRLWRVGDARSAQTVLLIEAWSSHGSASSGFRSVPVVGWSGVAGNRFGGGGGLRPFTAGRFGRVNCELDYGRHRKGKGKGVEAVGRLSVAFADGHVELLSNADLVSPAGSLTGAGFWSALDTTRK